METKDFYYDLPKELIAQTPVEPRDSSRLLVMDKTSGELDSCPGSDEAVAGKGNRGLYDEWRQGGSGSLLG